MTTYKVVVDGSNIATEGRSLPSLNQLDEAVQSFVEEHPGAEVLVIVDTSFAHRVDPSESQVFESAYEAGEIIMPPAGTIGRGDSFILKVADKLGATVFSNDSFQEFHGTYDWLFDRGRLIGGKPVPGLGWVFMDRTPVRGPKSREAVREAKRSQVRIGSKEAMRPMPVPKAPPAFAAKKAASMTSTVEAKSSRRPQSPRAATAVLESNDEGTLESPVRDGARRGRRDRRRGKGRDQVSQHTSNDRSVESTDDTPTRQTEFVRRTGEPINEPLAFISFVAEHGIGTLVEGEIESYSSHGFYVTVAGARGYSPLHGLAEPMPRSAKEVVRRGETHSFLVASFDAERRGIQLALVGSPAATAVPAAPAPVGKKAVAKKAVAKKVIAKKVIAKKAVAAEKAVVTKKPPVKVPAKAVKAVKAVKPLAPKPASPKPASKVVAKAVAKPVTKPVTKVASKAVKAKAAETKVAPAKKTTAKKAPVQKTPATNGPTKAKAEQGTAKASPAMAAAKKPTPIKVTPVKGSKVQPTAPSKPVKGVAKVAKSVATKPAAKPVSPKGVAKPTKAKAAPAKKVAARKTAVKPKR